MVVRLFCSSKNYWRYWVKKPESNITNAKLIELKLNWNEVNHCWVTQWSNNSHLHRLFLENWISFNRNISQYQGFQSKTGFTYFALHFPQFNMLNIFSCLAEQADPLCTQKTSEAALRHTGQVKWLSERTPSLAVNVVHHWEQNQLSCLTSLTARNPWTAHIWQWNCKCQHEAADILLQFWCISLNIFKYKLQEVVALPSSFHQAVSKITEEKPDE